MLNIKVTSVFSAIRKNCRGFGLNSNIKIYQKLLLLPHLKMTVFRPTQIKIYDFHCSSSLNIFYIAVKKVNFCCCYLFHSLVCNIYVYIPKKCFASYISGAKRGFWTITMFYKTFFKKNIGVVLNITFNIFVRYEYTFFEQFSQKTNAIFTQWNCNRTPN